MAKTWHIDEKRSIEFSDFISFLDNLGSEVFSVTNNDAVANAMRRLCNNRKFFADHLMKGLQGSGLSTENPYTSRVFVLCDTDHYQIRGVVWEPNNELYDDDSSAYTICHDHNFDFFTIGYYGPGYKTKIYNYDVNDVVGYSGEAVDMKHLEDTTLDYGKVMLYTHNVDVHLQVPPPSLSISINILNKAQSDRQYEFDSKTRTVVRQINSTPYATLLSMGSILGGQCIQLVKHIAEHGASSTTRFEAIKPLIEYVDRKYVSLGRRDTSRDVQILTERLYATLTERPMPPPPPPPPPVRRRHPGRTA